VTTKAKITVAVGAVVLLWAGLAYHLSRPDDYRHYTRTMVQVAQAAHDAAQTGRLVAQQQLAGRVTGRYATAAYDDATKGVAGAAKKFAGQGPPDDASRRLRDQLSPLLGGTVAALGDTAQAGDDSARRAAADHLGELAGQLGDFVEAYG
jgi:hypothetical protein